MRYQRDAPAVDCLAEFLCWAKASTTASSTLIEHRNARDVKYNTWKRKFKAPLLKE